MKKLIYYPAAGVCFLGAYALGQSAVSPPSPNIPTQVRLQLGGYAAALAVAGTACIKVANEKKVTKED